MIADESRPILIVEDSDDDFEATVRALGKDKPIRNRVVRCENGGDAMRYLYSKTGAAVTDPKQRPGLVLLDLNMPGFDGRNLLAVMRKEKSTKTLPVVILTTSDDEMDIKQCYEMGANTYIKKPVELEKLNEAFRCLKEYWFEFAVIPKFN